MNIWVKSVATGAVIAIAVYFFSEKLREKKKIKKYSLEYTIEAKPDKESALPFSLSKVIEILEERLQSAAYKYKIEKNGGTTIHVSLSGILDTLNPNSVFTSNGRVQFRELYNIIEVKEMLMAAFGIMQDKNPAPEKIDSVSKKTGDLTENLEPAVKPKENSSLSLIEFSQPYQSESGNPVYPSEIGRVKLKDTAAITELFRSEKVRHLTPADLQVRFGEQDKKIRKDQKQGDQLLPVYFLKTYGSPDKALLENEDISEATPDFDQYGHVEIRMQFNKPGSRKWAYMTRANIGRPLAIIINNRVISAPNVVDAIMDGSSSITGNYTIAEANEICMGLKSTKIPATLRIISSVVKQERSPTEINIKLLVTLITLIVFTILAFFVFKTLKLT